MIIRLAKKNDEINIRNFIHQHWKKNHILYKDDIFWDYEMCRFGFPSYIIAIKEKNIVGILGFIANQDTIENSDLFLAILKVLNQKGTELVGVKLIKFIMNLTKKGVHCIGVNKKVIPYYKFLGFQTGTMKHYYWLNHKYNLSKPFIRNKNEKIFNIEYDKKFTENNEKLIEIKNSKLLCEKIESFSKHSYSIKKSTNFFYRRYFQHPKYKYNIYTSESLNGVGVIRIVKVGLLNAYRIVDWHGLIEDFSTFSNLLIKRAIKNNISFIDLYYVGINKLIIDKSGLLEISKDVTIPNYLEPLLMENVNLSFVTSFKNKPTIFRGDGDQDRPSTIS